MVNTKSSVISTGPKYRLKYRQNAQFSLLVFHFL